MTGAAASDLVAACEQSWRSVQRQHPEVPDAVMLLGTGVERGRLVKLGHWWDGRWTADGEVRGEVLLAGEALHLDPSSVFEVLLHEAAHGLNAARRIKDTSRGGRYHNARFKAAAIEVGLDVDQMDPYGFAKTTLRPATVERYSTEIDALSKAMRIARRVPRSALGNQGTEVGPDAGTDGNPATDGERRPKVPPAECGCGRRLRMAPSVLAQGPVICGNCGTEFLVAPSPSRATAPGVGARGLSDQVDRWWSGFDTEHEVPMTASSESEQTELVRLARARLDAAGRLTGPEVLLKPGLAVRAGDRVRVTATLEEALDLPDPEATGEVRAVETESGTAIIDFPTAGIWRVAAGTSQAEALSHAYTAAPGPVRSHTASEGLSCDELELDLSW